MNYIALWLSVVIMICQYHDVLSAAVIGNGQVILGVDDNAQLNVPYVGGVLGLPAIDPVTFRYTGEVENTIGVRSGGADAGLYAATESGCDCEGWGVGIPNLDLAISANNHYEDYVNPLWIEDPVYMADSYYADYYPYDDGLSDIKLVSFTGSNGGDSATSIVRDIGDNLEVTHYFHPSADSIYAMRLDVTIKNIGTNDFESTLYRRTMDWDLTPTEFEEYVTTIGTDADQLVFSNANGFCSANPLITCFELVKDVATTNVDFKDVGPGDYGATFDFDLGPLSPGEEVSFIIYYGAAPGEDAALQSLNDISAEVASYAKPLNSSDLGLPYTFFFAFGNVGGEVIGGPNEPSVDVDTDDIMALIEEYWLYIVIALVLNGLCCLICLYCCCCRRKNSNA